MIDLVLLGTGATMPTPERGLSAAALRCAGRGILFDCGEGTQPALRREKVSPVRIDLIALTHYHGDHIFGLPGLLQTMQCLRRTEPLYLTGPEGLAEVMRPILMLAGPLSFPLYLVTLKEREPLPLHALHAAWPKLASLQSAAASHRVPCRGYAFSLDRAPEFLPEKAKALGVPVSQWKALASAPPDAPLTLDGAPLCREGRPILAEDLQGPPRRGLKLVFSGDTAPCEGIRELARDADLLIHDATYGEDQQAEEAALWGHSTFRQAAELAADAGAKCLWLTHFSQTIRDPEAYLENARAVFPAAQCGCDGLSVTLRFEETKNTNKGEIT